MKEANQQLTWEELVDGMYSRFGPTQFQDPFVELTKLNRDYQTQFEKLLICGGQLSNAQQVSCFIRGLKPRICIHVQAGKLTSLTEAIGLARLFEEKVKLAYVTTKVTRPPMQEGRRTINVKQITPAEMKDRRDQGLCFNCDEQFGPGHKCKKLFYIEMVENLEDGEPLDREGTEAGLMAISLHAISAEDNPKTMRLLGTIKGRRVAMLVDSGATHNFMDCRTARSLALASESGTGFEVRVANGDRIIGSGRCSDVVITI
ncbi:hypothetical protein LINGRAHAP2_LOCUS2229 [Linum grandiflorum]